MGLSPEVAEFCAAAGAIDQHYGSARLRFYLPYLLGDIDVADKSVLDIGGGSGLLSFYAAAAGARRAVCVEPEGAGATAGVLASFRAIQQAVPGGDRVELVPTTLQDYQAGAERFEVVFMHHSIHHLDEEALDGIYHDPAAQARYVGVLRKLYDLTLPGAQLVVVDCSRFNFWAQLLGRNPFLPAVNYRRHPEPRVWSQLLAQAGFQRPRVRWIAPGRLGRLGAALCSNRLGAYLTHSHYRLVMTRGD